MDFEAERLDLTYFDPNRNLRIKNPLDHLPSKEKELVLAWLYHKPISTQKVYAPVIIKFFSQNPYVSLKPVSPAHLITFLKSYGEITPATTNKIKSVFSSLYIYLMKQGYLDKNPATAIDRIKAPHRISEKILTRLEISQMLKKEANFRNRVLILLLYKTGMRASEILSLKVSNFKVQYPRKNEASKIFCKINFVGKGKKVRAININIRLYRLIRRLILNTHGDMTETNYIFCAENTKKPLSHTMLIKIIGKAAKKIGIQTKPTPHWFRHTNATHALNRGAPIHVVQKTLGHASLSTTGIYTELNPKESSGDWL